jgi:ketosteroid isomerase-like protein
MTGPSNESATAFVENYGQTWETWDVNAFLDLFSEDVVYVAHPTEETVLGREALGTYLRKEQGEQGDVRVNMGRPIVEGDHVAAEFWVTAVNRGREATIAGCLVAQLDANGRCTKFREYWFDVEGHTAAPSDWGK